jgi:hypothetical protein
MLTANVGDTLLVHGCGGRGRLSLETVERTTATQTITADHRFRTVDGELVGVHDTWNHVYAEDVTPEGRARYEKQEADIAKIARLRALRDRITKIGEWGVNIPDAALANAEAAIDRLWAEGGQS